MGNYRVTFGGEGIDYKSNFSDCLQYMEVIQHVFATLGARGVTEKWWFFEPYVEITWLSHQDWTKDVIIALERYGITDYKMLKPEDGDFADWFGLTPEERRVSAKRYSKLAKLALYYHDNDKIVKEGLGRERHLVRNVHVLANQFGMNYQEEGVVLIKRGIMCLLFWHLPHKDAVDAYEKMFNEKYFA